MTAEGKRTGAAKGGSMARSNAGQAKAAKAATAGGPRAPHYPIESVDNALRLLLLFEEKQQVRLTEAATYLAVASSTAHRLLAMLQYRGFVRQNQSTRAYEPGPALGSIAFAIMRQIDVRSRARPVLERLNKEFGETIHLGRLEGQHISFLDSIESTRAVRVSSRVGRALPAHATSSGKATLSQMSGEELRRLYPHEDLDRITDNTITSRAKLERALDTIRRRGYALSNEESEDGVASVAVPVASPTGVLYAVNVSVPTHRMTRTLRNEIADSLKSVADELSSILM
jgi:IclR family transcriptional regulator, acetate operon repressor